MASYVALKGVNYAAYSGGQFKCLKQYCTINGYDRNNQSQAAFSYFSSQCILLKDDITRVHLWRCEFLLIGGDFTEQSQCRMHIGEIMKESNIWTFSVHYATL